MRARKDENFLPNKHPKGVIGWNEEILFACFTIYRQVTKLAGLKGTSC